MEHQIFRGDMTSDHGCLEVQMEIREMKQLLMKAGMHTRRAKKAAGYFGSGADSISKRTTGAACRVIS